MKTVYRKPNPHLFDVAIDEIQTALDNECSWLNTIFGRCERLVKEINGNKYYTANWYKAKNDYIQIAPDEGLGNFCFFVLDEPTDLENYFVGDVTRSTIGFSLIVWCDLRTIGEGRDTEAVKEELLQILNGRTHLRSGRMTINKVYERAENVFREFDYDEIDNQFMMHPFAGFRIEGELMVDTLCDAYIPPTPPVIPPYIKGHIIDGASTFTFTINGQTQTVNVEPNGWWKWEANITVTSLRRAFASKLTIDEVYFYGLKEFTTAEECFVLQLADGTNEEKSILKKVTFDNCDFSHCTNESYMFARRYGLITLIGFDNSKHSANTNAQYLFLGVPCGFDGYNWQNVFCSQSINLNSTLQGTRIYETDLRKCKPTTMTNTLTSTSTIRKIGFPIVTASNIVRNTSLNAAISEIECEPMSIIGNIVVSQCNALFESAILNLINAAAANVTYTLHSTVYAKCSTGGEWNADVQAAIDAKAAQGFTVTLISA